MNAMVVQMGRQNRVSTSPPSTCSMGATTTTTSLGTMTVPKIAVGTISWTKNDKEELKAVVQHSIDSGVGLFDTAERYGASGAEVALGLGWGACETELGSYVREALEHRQQYKHPRNADPLPPVVATKFTPSPWRTTAESVVEACEKSRERLGVDSIDLYQIHMPDIVHPLAKLGLKAEFKDEIYWEGLAQCWHKGLVKNCGVSNYGPSLLKRCHAFLAARGVPLASNQINYSLLYRNGGANGGVGAGKGLEGAQAAVDTGTLLGVRTLAYFPLAMGLLTGKYHDVLERDQGGQQQQQQQQHRPAITPASHNRRSALEEKELRSYVEATNPLLRVMAAIGEQHGAGPTQVALNWVVSKGAVPVVGCRTLAHVEGAAKCLDWSLTRDEVELLEQAADATGVTFEGAGFKRSSEKFVGYGVETWKLD